MRASALFRHAHPARLLRFTALAAAAACGGPAAPPPADRDGDGFTVDEDCDDADPGVYPGAPDPSYDGVDADCDGGDDFDRDRDGHRWERYGGDDCDDNDPAIHPGATEVPYDGRDNDCDPRTSDADLDGDGANAPADCDDADPEVYPGAIERLGDGRDNDCGGDADGTQLIADAARPLDDPRAVRLGSFAGAPMLAMAVSLYDDGAEVWYHPVLLLADFGAEAEQTVVAHGSDNRDDIDADQVFAIDLDAAGDVATLAIGYRSWISGQRLAIGQRWVPGTIAPLRMHGANLTLGGGSDLAAIDGWLDGAGEVWFAAGSADDLAWANGSGASGRSDTDGSSGVAVDDAGVHACGAAECTTFTAADPPQPVAEGGEGRLLRARDAHRLRAGAAGLTVDGPLGPIALFSGVPIVDADLVVDGDRLLVVAVDDAGAARVSWGAPSDGLLSLAALTFFDADRTITSVAVVLDGDDVQIVGAARDRLDRDGNDRLAIARLRWDR